MSKNLSRTKALAKRVRADRGMTTAEYAVGTVAAATFAGVLITIFKDPAIWELLLKIILWILKFFTGFGG